jgi:hypothetical protein
MRGIFYPMETPNWTRNPAGDRPALSFGKRTHPIPKQLGFINEFGSEVQVSVDHALSLGLIDRAPKKGKTVGIHSYASTIYKRLSG